MLLPKISESLAGRMEIHTLWPFSQGELAGARDNFIDKIWKLPDKGPPPVSAGRGGLAVRIVKGGYPEAVRRSDEPGRGRWYGSYITTILQRDIREITNIEGLTDLPRILSLLAARTSSPLNYAELSRSSGVPQSTLKRYMALLQAAFLLRTIPPWTANLSKKLVKSPKLFLTDTGMTAYLMGMNTAGLESNKTIFGQILENFIVMELIKQASWSNVVPAVYHFRSHSGQEVDVVLERRDGTCVGIDVKASQTIGPHDFKGLRVLADLIGQRFIRVVVLYSGSETVPFSGNLHALPIHALWS